MFRLPFVAHRCVVRVDAARLLASFGPDAPAVGAPRKVPVTVLTGFLGSGKTTLLNHILNANHGKKIAVIENEFGEIGIDDALVKQKHEAEGELIVEMNNGCLCCSVRDDLVTILRRIMHIDLMESQSGRPTLDSILIETTGMARPTPIAQAFFSDPALQEQVTLDGVLTVVDAKHVTKHLNQKGEGRSESAVGTEVAEQISFADVILLNKTDLVDADELSRVEAMLQQINCTAHVHRTQHGQVTREQLDSMLHLEAFDLDRVGERLQQSAGQHDHHPHGHSHEHGEAVDDDHHHHHHHSSVGSVAFELPGDLDSEKLEGWLGSTLEKHGDSLFRVKGVLALEGAPNKLVLQAVHCMYTADFSGPWEAGEARSSKLVMIGRDLAKEELRAQFEACRASQSAV